MEKHIGSVNHPSEPCRWVTARFTSDIGSVVVNRRLNEAIHGSSSTVGPSTNSVPASRRLLRSTNRHGDLRGSMRDRLASDRPIIMDDAAPLIIESDGTRRKGSTRHLTDEWLLEFPDKTLRYLRFDHSIRLQIGASLVGIESPFELLRNGATHRCDPDDPQSVVPLL